MTDEQRPYRKALSKDEVREYIRSLAGTQLDPKIVDAFLKMAW
jgi:HD-GYP domain-containing protein (c-di-GMP phosphodiesterase class II)